MTDAYSFDTDRGAFGILPGLNHHWHVIWDGEDLGAFATPQVAAAASGHLR